jgi:hypothetical protein
MSLAALPVQHRAGLSPSVGETLPGHASLQMSDASLVLLPESFRGGCSIGAGFTGLSQIACANDAAYIAVARREQLAKSGLTHYAGEA